MQYYMIWNNKCEGKNGYLNCRITSLLILLLSKVSCIMEIYNKIIIVIVKYIPILK